MVTLQWSPGGFETRPVLDRIRERTRVIVQCSRYFLKNIDVVPGIDIDTIDTHNTTAVDGTMESFYPGTRVPWYPVSIVPEELERCVLRSSYYRVHGHAVPKQRRRAVPSTSPC